ncbi:MAG TPA: virulence factor TspB C-terminal domain-related protein [Acinetobacter johnsonii]|nr:virulence factor TspB C-terminal domain-related protein [Acinetobacter johnsonii]
MAINDGFYRYKNVLKKQLKLASRIYLSIAIVLAPIFFINSANASTLAGGSGWRVASTVSNGIGVTVNGAKDIIVNGAKKTVTGVANVTPTASQVGKFMGKNLAGAAVIASMDLLLDGADYVLDPANNRIVYKQLGTGLYTLYTFTDSSKESVCRQYADYSSQYGYEYHGVSGLKCQMTNPAVEGRIWSWDIIVNTQPQEEEKSIPLVDLGSQVLDQAETEVKTGNPAVPIATPVTQAAAAAVVGEAATDEAQARPITAELDKSAAIPTDQTAVGEIAPPTTNPETGQPNPTPLSIEFPVFCSWAPSMCVLADKVTQAITDATDWATTEPQQKEPENLEIEDLELDASDVNLTATGSCPQDSVSFSVMGKSVSLDMPYQPVCDALNFFKPAVLLVGAVASVYIVAGVRTKEEDQA